MATFAVLEQQRQVAAAKAPTDYAAVPELDALMAKLARADDEVTASARAVTIEAEVEQIVNDLLPTLVTLRGQLDRWYEQFAERADVPDDNEEWVPFNLAAIEFERLRSTIQLAVGEDAEALDVSRGFDNSQTSDCPNPNGDPISDDAPRPKTTAPTKTSDSQAPTQTRRPDGIERL